MADVWWLFWSSSRRVLKRNCCKHCITQCWMLLLMSFVYRPFGSSHPLYTSAGLSRGQPVGGTSSTTSSTSSLATNSSSTSLSISHQVSIAVPPFAECSRNCHMLKRRARAMSANGEFCVWAKLVEKTPTGHGKLKVKVKFILYVPQRCMGVVELHLHSFLMGTGWSFRQKRVSIDSKTAF